MFHCGVLRLPGVPRAGDRPGVRKGPASKEILLNTEFTLVEERSMAEVNGTARFYRHNATGAQIVSVTNDDENKVFGVTFRTTPK